MRSISPGLAALVVLNCLTMSPLHAQENAPKLEKTIDKVSYQLGIQVGTNLKRQGLELDPKFFAQGVAAALAGQKSVLTDEEVQAAFQEFEGVMRQKVAEKATKNLEDGKKFLEANKAKANVKVTPSGLQYMVLKEGTGATPTAASTVSTHYRGTLIDGKKFDASYEGDAPTADEKPVSFGVTQVIKGWTEALQLMKVGSRYRLFIPSELAYGANGPGEIGPNSVLIFDIELIGIE